MEKKVLSENIEEYLEVIYDYSDNKSYVSTTTISKSLNIAPGSVTQMLKKLEKEGYVKYEPYKGVMLSFEGYKIAKKIKRKHRILEKFLTDVLNIKKENVHKQACDMEHSLSDEAERAMCHLMEHPDKCPDNLIIPECDFNFNSCEECLSTEENIDEIKVRSDYLLPITQVQKNNKGRVNFIRGNPNTIYKFAALAIGIGVIIKIIENSDKNKNIIIEINNKQKEISRKIANNVFLKLIE